MSSAQGIGAPPAKVDEYPVRVYFPPSSGRWPAGCSSSRPLDGPTEPLQRVPDRVFGPMRLLASAIVVVFLAQAGLCSVSAFGLQLPGEHRTVAQSVEPHDTSTSARQGCHTASTGATGADSSRSGDDQCREHCRLYKRAIPGSASAVEAPPPLRALGAGFFTPAGALVNELPGRAVAVPPRKRPLQLLHSVFRI